MRSFNLSFLELAAYTVQYILKTAQSRIMSVPAIS